MNIIHKELNNLGDHLAVADIDFYASIITPWHLINVEAFLFQLGKEKHLRGILEICNHSKSGFIVHKEDVVQLPNIEMNIVYNQETLNTLESMDLNQRKNRDFYIVCALDYKYELGKRCSRSEKNVHLVRTDEGLFEYYGKDYQEQMRINDGIKKRVWYKAFLDTLILKRASIGWKKEQLSDRWLMCKDESGQYVPQKNVVDSVRKYLQFGAQPVIHKFEKYALFLSAPWDENDSWNLDDYRKLLSQLDSTLTNMGIKLYVKNHPRENRLQKYTEWGIEIFDGAGMAMEPLLANLTCKPVAMIGLESTALINASMLGGCSSISLKRLVKRENTKDVLWLALDSFEKNFSGYVNFIDSMEDITGLLS